MMEPDTNTLKADLHLHSLGSFDCRLKLPALFKAAQKAGLNAVALTDHDSLKAIPDAQKLAPQYGIQLVPGVEITTSIGTHIVGYYLHQLPKDLEPLAVIKHIHDQGGVSMLPHPYRSDSGLIGPTRATVHPTKLVERIIQEVDLIEGLNFKSVIRQEGKLDPRFANLTYVAGSDAHFACEIGQAFVEFSVPSQTILTPEIMKHAARKLVGYLPSDSFIKKHLHQHQPAKIAEIYPNKNLVGAFQSILPKPITQGLGNIWTTAQYRAREKAKIEQIQLIHQQTSKPVEYSLY